uniref:Arylamine N-acetyltransferase n=1 Tax=Panagrolaimus sp. ES5 TaxID=591445 RepID=A0AC34F2T2_9BILA
MENNDDFVVDEYLKRLEINLPDKVDKEYLDSLHIAHCTHIPFETFDLIDLKELNISPKYIFNRLIQQKRGGLNGSFEKLLKNLKYNVQMIPCCVFNITTHAFGNCDDHLALLVTFDDGTKYMCDAGFSRNFLTPLIFETDCIQFATTGFFRLTKTDNEIYYQLERGYLIDANDGNDKIVLPSMSKPETCIVDIDPNRIKWTISYRFPINFAEKTTKLEDFQDATDHVIHSPDCILNQLSLCRIEAFKPPFIGAYGIVGKEFVEYSVKNGIESKNHFPISTDENNDDELKKILKEKFNLQIDRKLVLRDH